MDRQCAREGLAREVEQLTCILEEIARLAPEVQAQRPGVRLRSGKPVERIVASLPELAAMPGMSVLELRYELPGTSRKPGVRFRLEGRRPARRLRAALFRDTVFWRVDEALHKVCEDLADFRIGEGEVMARRCLPAGEESWRPAWREVLREVLLLPAGC